MVAVFFSAALDCGVGEAEFALWRLGHSISVGNGEGGRGMNQKTLFHIV